MGFVSDALGKGGSKAPKARSQGANSELGGFVVLLLRNAAVFDLKALESHAGVFDVSPRIRASNVEGAPLGGNECCRHWCLLGKSRWPQCKPVIWCAWVLYALHGCVFSGRDAIFLRLRASNQGSLQ